MKNVMLAREAMITAGRPGLPIQNALATAESAVALIAALHPKYGIRTTDGAIAVIMDPMNVDFERLNKAFVTLSYGLHLASSAGPLLGGYCGGPEGTSIANVAAHFAGALVYKATYFIPFAIHLKYGCSSTPDVLWVINTSGQAVSRNTDLLSVNMNYTAAGPCTKMILYETAASVKAAVVSGFSMESTGAAKAKYEDRQTPMESKFPPK